MKSTQLTKFYALGLVALSACRTTVIEAPPENGESTALTTTTSAAADPTIKIVVPEKEDPSSTPVAIEAVPTGDDKGEGKETTIIEKKKHPFSVKMTIDRERIQTEIALLTEVYEKKDNEPGPDGKPKDGKIVFVENTLAPYTLTDANWLKLDSRVGQEFMEDTVMKSANPPRTMAFHRIAFKYAYYDIEGLDMNRVEATEFANNVLKEKDPELYLVVHKDAMMYAVYETDGLKRNLVEGRAFAKKVASHANGDKLLLKHREEFAKAQKPRNEGGQDMGTTEALRYANKVAGLVTEE